MFLVFMIGLTVAKLFGFADPSWYLLSAMWVWAIEDTMATTDLQSMASRIDAAFWEVRERLCDIERKGKR